MCATPCVRSQSHSVMIISKYRPRYQINEERLFPPGPGVLD
jgi:hypothetical protein